MEREPGAEAALNTVAIRFTPMITPPITHAKRVLCLGAHSDDIEIGAGGTLLRLAAMQPELSVHWVVFSAPGKRKQEAEQSAEAFLAGVKNKRIEIGDFRESYFPSEWPVIKDLFEGIRKNFEPDLIFTHFREDRHQDHRVLSDLAWNTFRNHLILEYEIPKYDGDLGQPNAYVALDPAIVERKIQYLMKYFESQKARHWFTADLFNSLLRIRGIECGQTFAEAFHARKIIL